MSLESFPATGWNQSKPLRISTKLYLQTNKPLHEVAYFLGIESMGKVDLSVFYESAINSERVSSSDLEAATH